MSTQIRAIFFDSGNTLIYPRIEELAEEFTQQGYPATVEDFFAAERVGKQMLDDWLWPQIHRGEVPRTIDLRYWTEYLRALVVRVGVPEPERPAMMQRVANRFRDITLWSSVLPDTPPFLEKLQAQGYWLGVEKPHPAIFRIALARVPGGIEPSQAIFVGDTNATDMGGAQLAGLRGVLIDRVGAYHHAECPRITSLPELESLL